MRELVLARMEDWIIASLGNKRVRDCSGLLQSLNEKRKTKNIIR